MPGISRGYVWNATINSECQTLLTSIFHRFFYNKKGYPKSLSWDSLLITSLLIHPTGTIDSVQKAMYHLLGELIRYFLRVATWLWKNISHWFYLLRKCKILLIVIHLVMSYNCLSLPLLPLSLSSLPSPASLFPSFPCPSIPFFPLPLYPLPSPALSPPFPSLIFPYPSNSFPSFPVPSIYPSSSAPAPCLLSLSLPSLSLYLFPPSLFPYLPTALK